MTQALSLKPEHYTTCMSNLDKLDWNYDTTVSAYGYDIGLRASDLIGLDEVRDRIPEWITPSNIRNVDRIFSYVKGGKHGNTRRYNLLYANHSLVGRSHDPEAIFDLFIDMLEISVAEQAKDHVFIHAGAVGWRNKVILLPGKSHAGKSTLVSELLKLGAEYYTDEYAVIDQNGNVEPINRPLYLREENATSPLRVTASDIGATQGKAPAPIALVVFSQYEQGAKWEPQSLSKCNGVLKLMENSFSAQRFPDMALRYLETVVDNASVITVSRGEAKEAAKSILKYANLTQ